MQALAAIRPSGAGTGERAFGLSGRQISRRGAAAARAAGLGDGFSGHSGRVGLAAELSRAGASTHEIALAGGWRSASMVIRYTRRETARRGAVARYLGSAEEPATDWNRFVRHRTAQGPLEDCPDRSPRGAGLPPLWVY